jgi:DNA-directed RNA polymerase III subunit RPC6
MSAQLQSDCDELRNLLLGNPDGVSVPALLEKGWDKERLKNAASALKQARKIEVVPHPTLGILFVAISDDMALKFAELSEEHRTVYKLISDANTQGIWAKELSTKSKIPTGTLARLTKTLEHRKLIKQITPAQYRSRKVWMLYELEPASELSGGSWYKDGQIDSELITRLRSATYQYISNCSEPVTAEDVQRFLATQSLSRSIESIESIIRTLVLDRELTMLEPQSMKGKASYVIRRKSNVIEFSNEFFSSIPCVGCPVRSQCAPGHNISPETCQFLARWLQIEAADDAI